MLELLLTFGRGWVTFWLLTIVLSAYCNLYRIRHFWLYVHYGAESWRVTQLDVGHDLAGRGGWSVA